MSDSVGQYLNEIGAVALLTADDEKMLSKAIEKGRDAQVVLDGEEKITAAERRSLRTAAEAKLLVTASSVPTLGLWCRLLAGIRYRQQWSYWT